MRVKEGRTSDLELKSYPRRHFGRIADLESGNKKKIKKNNSEKLAEMKHKIMFQSEAELR